MIVDKYTHFPCNVKVVWFMFFVSVLRRFNPILSCIFIMFVQLYIISTVSLFGGGGSRFVVLNWLLLFFYCFGVVL